MALRSLLRCIKMSRRLQCVFLLILTLTLFIKNPIWNILHDCQQYRTNITETDTDEKLLLHIVRTAAQVRQCYLKFYKHKVYTNEEMVKALLGEKKGLAFIRKENNKNKCSEATCPHRTMLEFPIPNTDACKGHKHKFFLLVVYSATWNFDKRQMVRKTWGRPNLFSMLGSTTIFILGTTTSVQTQKEISRESERYKDIVQAGFHDSYANLSLKGRSYLQWASHYCHDASYIIKADDDQYIDIIQIAVTFLYCPVHQPFILGIVRWSVIQRNNSGKKNYVHQDVFPMLESFPTFVHGSTYVFSGEIVRLLVEASLKTPIFHLDDVYMTGVLVGQVPGMAYYRFRTRKTENKFQPTFPHLNKRVPDLEDVRSMWCRHVLSVKEHNPELLNEATILVSLEEAKCD